MNQFLLFLFKHMTKAKIDQVLNFVLLICGENVLLCLLSMICLSVLFIFARLEGESLLVNQIQNF